jgi:serine/threonine protein kinase/beta-lactam-binding protein with PASTA domain
MTTIAEQVGRVVGGRYRLLAPVGAGASSQVFAASDTRLDRRVAVKVLHPMLATDRVFLRRFSAEARLAASLDHPSIMRVFDWGEEAEGPYLVLEFLGGGSLRALLDTGVLLNHAQAARIGAEAAAGLAYAHRRGIVHRDIKPGNLIFDEEGRLRIADFGVARALAESAMTEPMGAIFGTARYASPEQAEGRALDDRSDVYSLALVLYEALTGRVPFTGDTIASTLMSRVGATLPIAPELGPLAPILAQAAISEPLARLDAVAMSSDLELLVRDLPQPEPLPLVRAQIDPRAAIRRDRDPTSQVSLPLPPSDGPLPPAAAAAAAADSFGAGGAADFAPRAPTPAPTPAPADRRRASSPASPAPPPPAAPAPPSPAAPPAHARTSPPTAAVPDNGGTATMPNGTPAAPPASTRPATAAQPQSASAAFSPTNGAPPPDGRAGEALGEGAGDVPSNAAGDPPRDYTDAELAELLGLDVGTFAGAQHPAEEDFPRSAGSNAATGATAVAAPEIATPAEGVPRPGKQGRPPKAPKPLRAAKDKPARQVREPVTRRWPKRLAWTLLVLILLGAAGTGGAFAYQRYVVYDHVVPKLTGMQLGGAKTSAAHAGLRLDVTASLYEATIPANQVLTQSIKPGRREKAGVVVRVTVSKGPRPVAVPDLYNDTTKVALAALTKAKLKPGKESVSFSNTVAKGRVITWTKKGSKVPPGTAVNIVVSEGHAPVEVPTIPTGDGWSQADQILTAAGFVPTEATVYTVKVPENDIVSVSLSGLQPYRSAITVTVSLGPPFTTVPDIPFGMSVSEAESLLRAKGLNFSVSSGLLGIDRVVDVSPGSGRSVRVGSVVVLYTP